MDELLTTDGVDSIGQSLSDGDKYLVARDGTFIFPDLDMAYDYLVRENWPTDLATHEDLMKVLRRECKCGAKTVLYNCTDYWVEIPLEEVIEEYGLDREVKQ